ncbi:MAG TPA: hypothetical protein VE242_06860 [Chthoniobacterales bacterium]|nr:hypothetical protein [Chthoniobacterales bacterium]
MTASRPLPSNVRPAHLLEAPATTLPRVIDFVPPGEPRRRQAGETIDQYEIEHEIRKAIAQRRRSIELYDPLEDWLYSLIPAAAVIALLVGVLGLLNSRTPSDQSATNQQPPAIEQATKSQGHDGKF